MSTEPGQSVATTSAPREYRKPHDDPEADIVLRSTDGHFFRVHSYRLRAASAFFRNMPLLKESPTPHEDDETVIDIDARTLVLEHLLARVVFIKTTRYTDSKLAWEVVALGQRYQFDLLPRLMVDGLHSLIPLNPGKHFAFASKHDLLGHAQAAIARFDEDIIWCDVRLNNLPVDALRGVPTEYVVALVRAMSATPDKEMDMNEEYDWHEWYDAPSEVDWSGVARAFRLGNHNYHQDT